MREAFTLRNSQLEEGGGRQGFAFQSGRLVKLTKKNKKTSAIRKIHLVLFVGLLLLSKLYVNKGTKCITFLVGICMAFN
jgi:hypothetical protein